MNKVFPLTRDQIKTIDNAVLVRPQASTWADTTEAYADGYESGARAMLGYWMAVELVKQPTTQAAGFVAAVAHGFLSWHGSNWREMNTGKFHG